MSDEELRLAALDRSIQVAAIATHWNEDVLLAMAEKFYGFLTK